MRAESQSLQRIFQGTVQYAVPLYQRPFVWRHDLNDPQRDRLGPFWDDVQQTVDRLVEHQKLVQAAGDPDKVAAMTPHFFGAVVIDGPTKVSAGITSHDVIDGQQRLTTAQLFVAAATRACDTVGRPNHSSRLRKLWMHDSDIEVHGVDRYKLSPTRFDRDSFARVMNAESDQPTGSDRLTIAYQYFVDQLSDWIARIPDGQGDVYFNALRDTIHEHLLFVVIELQSGDNPQGIFESLNAQGERLLAIDLVKNQVFRNARRANIDLDQLDTEVWSARFGEEWWRTDVKQGRYRRPRAELFLMHWLTEQTNADISATGLFVEFVRLSKANIKDPSEAQRFIDGFVTDAGIYRHFDSLESESRERLFFSRREDLDVGVVYPVALRLWRSRSAGAIDGQRLLTGLRALESWLVRRMTLRLTTQNYNRVMVDLLGKMAADDDPVTGLIAQLRSYAKDTPTAWWPDDLAFRQQLEQQPLYGWITQARVRMLLEAAEARLHTSKTERIALPPKLSIEHVIPQTWSATWALPTDVDDDARARRTNSIHRLGNLTLVTSSLNPALSNDPWAAKPRRASRAQRASSKCPPGA